MITAIKNENAALYRDLFEEASCLLSGYERTQTFDADKEYFYRDSKTKKFIKYEFESIDNEGKLYEFANALTEYGNLYTPTEKGPVKNFVPELGITTLEEYYNWLPDLKRGADNKPTKYTMLPLDESHFEINANTRAILIPNEFKKNGVAVQGDDLAEVVYFKVDRYFDAMDFNNTTIYIEWETPKDKDHPAVKGVSDIYIKDIESEPGKLIFGWALSDAITRVAGPLKFSVRFLQWEEQKISYSFSTLVAQATIHPSLDLDLEEGGFVPDNVNDRLLERIEASEVVGGAKAAIPYYLQNLEILDSYDIEDNHTDGTYKLYAVATSDDTGAISYIWKRSDLDENNISDGAWITVDDSSNTEMVLVDIVALDYKLEQGHRYHIANGDGTYKLYDLSYDLKEAYGYNIDSIPEIYEEKAFFVVEKYGQYKVEARNRIFNSLTKKDSNVAVFKRPEHIEMDNSNQTSDKHIIDTESAVLAPIIIEAIGDLSYKWYKAPDEGKDILKAHTVVNLPAGSKVSYNNDTIRAAFPDEAKWAPNDPENYPADYVWKVRAYAPANAAKYTWTAVRGAHKTGLQANTQKFAIDPVSNSTHVGSDDKGLYVVTTLYAACLIDGKWIHICDYQSDLAYGEKGNTVMIEWYNAQDEKISVDNFNVEYYKTSKFEPLIAFNPIEGANSENNVFVAEEPGYYQLKVVRTRNRATTEGESIEYRVTHAPAVPIFDEDTFIARDNVRLDDLKSGARVLSIGLDPNIRSDEYFVTWKIYRENKEDIELTTQRLKGVYTTSINPTDPIYAEVFEKAGEDVEAVYYATVINKLNGVTSAPTEVPNVDYMFHVLDY